MKKKEKNLLGNFREFVKIKGFVFLSQMGHVLAIRSGSRSLFSIGMFSNKPLFGAVSLTFVLQLLINYIPFLQSTFKTQSLSLNEFIIVGIASSLLFFAEEIDKVISKRANRQLAPA